MHDQRDSHVSRSADAIKVVADVSEDEGRLVEIGKVIGDPWDSVRRAGHGFGIRTEHSGKEAWAGHESRLEQSAAIHV